MSGWLLCPEHPTSPFPLSLLYPSSPLFSLNHAKRKKRCSRRFSSKEFLGAAYLVNIYGLLLTCLCKWHDRLIDMCVDLDFLGGENFSDNKDKNKAENSVFFGDVPVYNVGSLPVKIGPKKKKKKKTYEVHL